MLHLHPLITREEAGMIARKRTHTLCRWWNDLNGSQWPKGLTVGSEDRLRQLMDYIACQVGMRHMTDLRRAGLK